MAVFGYSSATSVLAGNSVSFHLSTDTPGLTNLTIERIGNTSISAIISTTLSSLSPPTLNPWEGFNWPVTASFNIPSNWPPGLYKLAYMSDDILTFVVRSTTSGSISKILFQVSFLTPTAYNAAGGKSLYGFNSGGESSRASKVSFDRPGGTPMSSWLGREAHSLARNRKYSN